MNRKGEFLVENIVFIVLNILYLVILILFLLKQGSGAIILEDAYSKNIALLIDSAKPTMTIHLNLQDLKAVSDKNGIPFSDVLKINGNYAIIKLSEKGGMKYHFFNYINVTVYPDKDPKYEGFYIMTFSKIK